MLNNLKGKGNNS